MQSTNVSHALFNGIMRKMFIIMACNQIGQTIFVLIHDTTWHAWSMYYYVGCTVSITWHYYDGFDTWHIVTYSDYYDK